MMTLIYILATISAISSTVALQLTDSCSDVGNFYQSKGYGSMVLNKPVLAENLNVCGGVYTCCTTQTEDRLSVQSMSDIQYAVSNKSAMMVRLLSGKHRKYDAAFLQLIETAKQSLDSLFDDTYGDLYTGNKMVFMKFFDDLSLYYQGGVVDLTDIFDGFFTTLMQKVFKLLNPSYIISEDYMQCIGDNLNVIKPFADLPQKLSNQVQRSFVAARTLVQALKTGERVTMSVGEIYPTTTCIKDFMKISHCSKCSGYMEAKPCQYTCDKVLTECLCSLGGDLNSAWNRYVERMMSVLSRLEGSFDIESVLFPIDVKISEAIMMLQENRITIKDAVTRQCGDLPNNPNATQGFGFGLGGFDLSGLDDLNFEDTGFGNLDLSSLSDMDFDFGGAGDDSGKRLTKRSADPKSNQRRRRRRKSRSKKRRARHRVRDVTSSKQKGTRHSSIRVKPDDDETNMVALLNEMHEAQGAMKHFWKKLPEEICADTVEHETQKNCWNGNQIVKNVPESVPSSFKDLCVNKTNLPDANIRQQIIILRDISAKLAHAYSGVDPAFLDGETPGIFSGDGSGEEGGAEEDVDEDEVLTEKVTPDEGEGTNEEISPPTVTRRKDKLIADLKDWQIDLIEQALGRSVDTQAKLKEIKTRLMKHPLFEKNSNSNKTPSQEKFGNLTTAQHMQLKKILGMRDQSKIEKDEPPPDVPDNEPEDQEEKPKVTEAPNNVDTTSGSIGIKWYSLPILGLVALLQRMCVENTLV